MINDDDDYSDMDFACAVGIMVGVALFGSVIVGVLAFWR